ncbi:hypothetical protein KP509_03G023600 [Ceratopteris richardii]|uniref:Glutaredoxin domain-containing protein n=1 Tax=Ceratopteris richardii TaxID=49495 RepID=A0A8T2V5E7_CERRI|nr:hypothetical protein KP509_03G023600 [Ceratopteris richardii]
MSTSQLQEILLANPCHGDMEKAACIPSVVQVMRPLEESIGSIERIAAESPVVIFGISTCCMCHVAKALFLGMGVNPRVVELDQNIAGPDMEQALLSQLLLLLYKKGDAHDHLDMSATMAPTLPAIFVGGQLIGGLDHLMACHISGTLIPLLKDAGALWL